MRRIALIGAGSSAPRGHFYLPARDLRSVDGQHPSALPDGSWPMSTTNASQGNLNPAT